jgi:ligand-binding sensor domain-containing protein
MKIFTPIIGLLLTILALDSCQAQTETPETSSSNASAKHNFASLETGETPIAEFVVDLMQDKDGTIWMSTMSKGAIKYDGAEIDYVTTTDGLLENTVIGVREDSDGNLWFGSHLGITLYNGTEYKHFGKEEGISGPGCSVFIRSNGEIWAKSNQGVFRFNGSEFESFHIPTASPSPLCYKWEPGKVWTYLEDSKGNMWFGLDGYGLVKYNGIDFTQYTTVDGLCSNNVSALAEDKDGNLWIGCLSSDFPHYENHGGVCILSNDDIQAMTDFEGLSDNDIYTLETDKEGNIWACAIGTGVYHFQDDLVTLYNKTDQPNLNENFAVQAFLETQDGAIWFGFSGGLFLLEGDTFIHLTEDDLTH